MDEITQLAAMHFFVVDGVIDLLMACTIARYRSTHIMTSVDVKMQSRMVKTKIKGASLQEILPTKPGIHCGPTKRKDTDSTMAKTT